MTDVEQLLERSRVHPEWRTTLELALAEVDPDYLHDLLAVPDWLPGPDRLLAAFRRDRGGLR